jgi:hypothetical protein
LDVSCEKNVGNADVKAEGEGRKMTASPRLTPYSLKVMCTPTEFDL